MVFKFDVLQLPILSCLWEGLLPHLIFFCPEIRAFTARALAHRYRREFLGISTIVYSGALGSMRRPCSACFRCLRKGHENLGKVAMAANA